MSKNGKPAAGKLALRWTGRILLILLTVLALLAIIFLSRGYSLYQKAVQQKPLAAAVEEIRDKEDYTPLAALPQTYLDAVVSAEDCRFYQHKGIDLISIGRAAIHDIQTLSLEEGGSTITQQLAKNLYFTQEKDFSRKFAEMFLAFDLERNYSKNEILELYVNTIYFGDGYYSVKEASQGYFGKFPSEMNQQECTLLAGIPNAPSVYAPTKNPDLAAQRQKQVLDKMVDNGKLTEQEAEDLLIQA